VSRSDDLRLLDIIEASERIARIIARGRGAFREDEAVQPALERLLEVIGESANALSEDARSAVANTAWDVHEHAVGRVADGDRRANDARHPQRGPHEDVARFLISL
jgi:uncharacterized protein with HEPN domain